MSEIIEQLEQSGERAFPFATKDFLCAGMTLRDYFAAKALQSMVSLVEVQESIGKKRITVEQVAGSCYEWADAMLKARDKA